MALLVISLLLLSVAFLSEAIDSLGTVPNLKLGSTKRRLKIPGACPNCGFGQSCDVEGFYNETEDEALLSVRWSTGTSYLRAVVFGKYEGGVWAPRESVRETYSGETMPSWVRSYSDKIEKDIVIKPLVNMSGYIPAVLNLRRINSEAPLDYDRDLRTFFSGTPFTTEYSLSYDGYTYGEDMLESARNVDDQSNLEIPEGFTGWLREIADEAAGDATTPYGRIRNVISYMKENYAYNLKYPPAPAGVDPVEWFLTGSREGVCTHFNSALVLLARSLGIPARLSGGYLIQPEAEAQLVYTRQRHAFSEIPFEELGWIIFDATPAAGCSECEGVESDGNEPGEEERTDTCSPTDSVYDQSSYEDCINNCTKLSPEGGAGPEVDLFEIRGVTGSNYLRTMVGERYDGLWNLVRPDPQPYGGGPISVTVSGYADDPAYAFTVSPLKEMGGFIPTTLYTNELWLDAEVERYQDQLIFFSTEVFREPYSLSITRFEFDYEIVNDAVTVSDSRYLSVPEDLLDRFRSFALNATSGAETPYEKLKALEAFLRNNYEYDTDYTKAPEGVDPVEWFLFHEGRGVCANFNSAFVLLARSLGLPTRLVVGYAIDSSAEWQVVNASQAHAYSEALFEGIGWITFDATASGVESEAAEEGDGEELKPVDEVFNQTECKDCVCNCTKMDPEGGMPPEVDLFQIHGVAGTAYLRTMVGEAYDGMWGMIEPSPETYENEVIRHQVSGYSSAQTCRFMVAPMVDMGGFIPSTLYTSELDLGWPLQRYPEHQVFFSDRRFNTSYIVSYTQYDYDPESLKGASLTEDHKYLGVPPELMAELRALALNATSGAETPYEKLKALEAFLRNNYEYDPDYTKAPEGVDPVEWFLFHEGRGVCANFNSAFVLLARSLGLPTRYVGGYLIDPFAETQTITTEDAHGYSEVPFEGLGWVTFDATGLDPVQKEGEGDFEGVRIIGTSTEITGQDAVGVKGLTINVVGRVLDENGDAVEGLRTLVYLKGNKTEVGLLCGESPVVGGLFNVTGSLPLNITTGDYLIEAHTLGDDRYNGSWSDPPLKVVSKTEFVLAVPEKVIAGKPFAFQGNLTEYKTGIPLSRITCTLEIGSEEAQLETDSEGFFKGVCTLTQPGNYTFNLEWPGSEYYLGSTTYSSVRIVPLTVTPDENEMMVRREEALITGRAHAEELPGAGEEVVVSIDGQDIGTATTDEEGRFTLAYEVPRTQELGEAQIGYRLKGGSYSTTQQSAVYARTQIKLEAPSSVRVKNQFKMDVTLKDDLGYPIGEAELTIEEEGEEQGKTVKTGSDGTKEVPLRVQEMPEDDTVTYTVSFEGEGYYLESASDVSLGVTRPIGLPEMDVIKTVTSVLIFSVFCLVGYTAYIIIQRRLRRREEDEPEEAQLAPDEPEPEPLKPAVGIVRLDDRFRFEFPQITDPFPLVWGVGEELVFRMGLAGGEGAFGGTVGVLLIVDGAEGPSFDLSIDGRIDHPMTFNEKGYHRIEVVFDSADARETACEAVIKIVDYREEVNDLFNEEFEEYEGLREEIKTHFTAREFMHSILKGLSDRFHAPLNEMVGIFEVADYSLHEIRRREYERFYAARHEFEEMKVGS